MSEYDKRDNRKKKFFSSPKEKEPILRRPVILAKNDRDSDREKQIKDKVVPVEKEKQHVIMIKTRELSATKESDVRPVSPKKSNETDIEIETQIIHPTKIVQNENKEKKKPSEINTLLPPTPMSHPMKLIDESHEFIPNVSEYLQDSNTGFLVVGVIGTQGVGKSTIMNILANSRDVSEISELILQSHLDNAHNANLGDSDLPVISPANTSGLKTLEEDIKNLSLKNLNKKEENASKSFVFKTQSMQHLERGEPCTAGIDIYITDTRVILLDAGASGGYGLSRLGGGPPVTGAGVPRGAGGGSGLEVAALLLAVCHVVILIQDWFTDVNMLRFIQSAEMVKPAVPAASNTSSSTSHPNTSTTSTGSEPGDSQVHREYYPHLLFLQNKCTAEDFKPTSIKLMQDLYRKAFRKSKMHIESGMYMYDPDSSDDSCPMDGLFHNLNAERCGKPVNLFLMPTVEDESDSDTYKGHPTIEELANRLRWQIFGVNRNQMTNVQLTERSWLHYCNKAWDNIRKSTFFIEYGRLLP